VLDAVQAGMFNIYAVSKVDQAMGLLAGEETGSADGSGHYPEGTINARVVGRLREIAELQRDDESSSNEADESKPASRT
jgi:hypothetical protein